MSATICPTITVETPQDYQLQMDKVTPFAGRLHLDLSDGQLAPRKLIDIDRLWWPGNKMVDLHLMYQRPFDHLDLFIAQHPNLIIVHAEAEGDFMQSSAKLHRHGIQVGVALLPQTQVRIIESALEHIDHLLIFSGNLGYQGGSEADLALLAKASRVKQLKPSIEVGWDGGVNADNARQLVDGGVDVLNVGGFIQRAGNPREAYQLLQSRLH